MNNVVFDLQLAGDAEKAHGLRQRGVLLEDALPNDHVHETGLVFQGQEHHAAGGAGTLAADDQARVAPLRAVVSRGDRARVRRSEVGARLL